MPVDKDNASVRDVAELANTNESRMTQMWREFVDLVLHHYEREQRDLDEYRQNIRSFRDRHLTERDGG